VWLSLSQVQHDYAEFQRELAATAAAGAPTLMAGLPPQSKSTSDRPTPRDVTQLLFIAGRRQTPVF